MIIKKICFDYCTFLQKTEKKRKKVKKTSVNATLFAVQLFSKNGYSCFTLSTVIHKKEFRYYDL